MGCAPSAPDGHHHQDKTYAEIEYYLKEAKRRIVKLDFKVSEDSLSREKNRDFMRLYNLATKERQKEILLGLECEDFLHTVFSTQEGNEGQELYVFCRKCSLYKSLCGSRTIWVYTKFDLIESSDQIVIVVSFHEAEREPGNFPFR
ncbi:MAG: hypothetical protein RR547_01235 [Raoultibacter sp.]